MNRQEIERFFEDCIADGVVREVKFVNDPQEGRVEIELIAHSTVSSKVRDAIPSVYLSFPLKTQEDERCAEVLRRCTPAQRKVLHAFTEGLKPEQVIERLNISSATVRSHCTALYALCRKAWGMPQGERMDYRFLRDKFQSKK